MFFVQLEINPIILSNHLFGDKEKEVKTIKQFALSFIKKMREINIIAEQARSIGLNVGLTQSTEKPKLKTNANEKTQDGKANKYHRCYYCGSSPNMQTHPHVCDLSVKDVKGCSFKNHPDVKNNDHTLPWKQSINDYIIMLQRRSTTLHYGTINIK